MEERPKATECFAPGDLHEVVDEGGHPIEDGYHDHLQEHYIDEGWASIVVVNEVDDVAEKDSDK